MYHYQRVHMIILPKERALVVKLPILPKDGKVNKFDFISGKIPLSNSIKFLLGDSYYMMWLGHMLMF